MTEEHLAGDAAKTTVFGEVRWPPSAPLPADAQLTVRVIDASTAGGPAVTLAEVTIPVSTSAGASGAVPFALHVALPNPRCDYRCAAEIRRAGAPLRSGDWISTRSYPVPAGTAQVRCDVELSRVA